MDLAQIYAEFHPRILRYLSRMVGVDEAEDIAQDVFQRVGRSLDAFRQESQLSTWIYRIATNAAMDRLRSPAVRRSAPMDAACEPASPASAEIGLIREQMSGCVQGLVRELPDNYRTVLILSDMEGMKDREIAEVLGISEGAAKIRLHRARTRLKQRMEEHCTFYSGPQSTLLCDIKPAQK